MANSENNNIMEKLAKLKRNVLTDLKVISLDELEDSEKERIMNLPVSDFIKYINYQNIPKLYEMEGDNNIIAYQLDGKQHIFVKSEKSTDKFPEGSYALLQLIPSIHLPLMYIVIDDSGYFPTDIDEMEDIFAEIDVAFSYLFDYK